MGRVIGIIISLVMIIGGLTGVLELRGTGSSTALVILGIIFLVIEIILIAKNNKGSDEINNSSDEGPEND